MSLFQPDQPLGLPAGSVRALIALLVIVPVAIISLKSNVQFTGDQVIGLASLVLTAYFVLKASAGNSGSDAP